VLAYAGVVLAGSIRAAWRAGHASPAEIARLLVIFPVLHGAHGAGVWAGLLLYARSGLARRPPERLVARV
jgi:hypothetical protein